MRKAPRHFRVILLVFVISVLAFPINGCLPLACVASLSDDTYEIESSAPESGSTFNNEKYAYNTLDDTSKKVYDELYVGITDMEEEIKISTSDENVLTTVTQCIDADHSDIFYIDGYSYYQGGFFGTSGFRVSPNYTMSRAERDNLQAQIDSVVDSWLSEVTDNSSDYYKSKWVYETLIKRADYVGDAPDNQNIISVFLNGQTVCQGYSAAAVYLFDRLGIQSFIVPGTTSEGPHAWNCVLLDGQYYYMDVTWGNSRYTDSNDVKKVNYSMLNVTTDYISRTHTVDAAFPVPNCTAIDDNYYYQEGCLFDTFEPDKMGKILHNGYVRGNDVSIKCTNEVTYNKMKQYFIDDTHFSQYVGSRTLQYTMYPDDLIIVYHFG